MTTKFVDIPGILEVRSVSDDPEHFEPPKDLFDLQFDGLFAASFGKKDRATTEQVFVKCLLCDCDLKSLVTLQAHCRGTQHLKKSRQKLFEWKKEHKSKLVEGKFPAFRKRSSADNEDFGGNSKSFKKEEIRDNEDFGGCSKGYKKGEVKCSRLDDRNTAMLKVEAFRDGSAIAGDNVDFGGHSSSIKKEVVKCSTLDNRNTAMVKVDSDVDVTSTRNNNITLSSSIITNCERSESEDVERLHVRVANSVMHCLKKYYFDSENSDPAQHKIMCKYEYEKLARQLSHQLREKIKESYYAYHSTLKGVELTADHAEVIRVEVDRFFEKK